jgi:methionyl-tRNA formyltransferase
MRVFILAKDDPFYLNPFLSKVIQEIREDVIGIGLVSASAPKASNQNRLSYFITLVIINGVVRSIYFFIVLLLSKIFSVFLSNRNPLSLACVARKHKIPLINTENVHSDEFIQAVKKLMPDVAICQVDVILKNKFLSIPKLGCLNRHGALLPKYRGRLAPFWAYLNEEAESGVSIHLINGNIDGGPILVQKRFPLKKNDSFNSLVHKVFVLAPKAMLEALEILRRENWENRLSSNLNGESTYYSSPTIKDAIKYRMLRLRKILSDQ